MSYKTIDGQKYKKGLLDLADSLVAGKGDGRISFADARELWADAIDGPGCTEIERNTLKYIIGKYNCTSAGTKYLKDMTDDVVSGTSYYKNIEGVKYVRALLDKADTLTKDGVLDKADAKSLWALSMNGGRVTETEKRTIEQILGDKKITEGAKKFFEGKLAELNSNTSSKRKAEAEPNQAKKAKVDKASGEESKEEAKAEAKEPEEKKEPEETKEAEETESSSEWMYLEVKKQCNFRDICLDNRIPYAHGTGYYELGTTGKTEKVQAYKKFLAWNKSTCEEIHGVDNVKEQFGFAKGELKLKKTDIPDGWKLFVQSTSANRVLKPPSTAAILVGSNKSDKGSAPTKERRAVGEYQAAVAGGRAHFSGGLMADRPKAGTTSECFVEDAYSEYVGVGAYNTNMKAFPKAIGASFDSICVDAGTRVTIYEKAGFQGKVLYSRIGPAVVVNSIWKDRLKEEVNHCLGKGPTPWKEPLNTIFPPEMRELSETDMHLWNSGSLIISQGEAIPEKLRLEASYQAIPADEEEKEE